MSTNALTGPPLAPFEDGTLNRLFLHATQRFAARPALGMAVDPKRWTYAEVEAQVAHIARALEEEGVGEGDRIVILSENRIEWALADYAALSLGAITVPIYPTLTAAQTAEIVTDAAPRLAFVSTAAQERKVAPLVPTIRFDELHAYAGTRDVDVDAWRERARAIDPESIATLIYTSGTTGTPKGVMLTHANLAAMAAATLQHGALAVKPGDVALSILPLSHVFERAASYYFFAHGVTIVYAESMQSVPRDLRAVRPHHVITVPRLLEKVHDAVTSAAGVKGTIARWAVSTAHEFVTAPQPSFGLRMRRAVADRAVYRVLRKRMGGRLRTFICGGAPLDARVGALFVAAGVNVFEGYGLTETSPVITANRPDATRLGTGGVPYPGVSIRLGAEDEIEVRGPGVTRGYWQKPDATAAAFTSDGWFRTGDVGTIDDKGFLRIVDRLKDLIVTAGGKNVAPQTLEQRVTSSPLISQAVVLGDRRPYLVMLVVPEAAVARTADFIAKISADIASHFRDFANFERPKRIAVLDEEFTVDNGLLTPTLKVRRRAIQLAYATLLDELYAGRAGFAIP
jgi:long-chain acyl-CoA synthetase